MQIDDCQISGRVSTIVIDVVGPAVTLLIAPDAYFRTMVRHLLEARGHAVVAAESATEALQLVGGRDVGVALLETDGQPDPHEAAEPLRLLPEAARILYLTSHVATARKLERTGSGALLRPFSPDELERAIARLLADGPR